MTEHTAVEDNGMVYGENHPKRRVL